MKVTVWFDGLKIARVLRDSSPLQCYLTLLANLGMIFIVDNNKLFVIFRYILVDWLAEVAAMKLFSTHTFHVAVGVVDRFLHVNSVPRSKLQLLGVSAMVLCSR